MLGKKMVSFKNLAKKVKSIKTTATTTPATGTPPATKGGEGGSESLLGEGGSQGLKTPTGTFAVYVGEERVRRVVPTSYLSHPLFRMLLDKSHDEILCFGQKVILVIPCSLTVFEDVVNAVESCNGKFDFGDFVEEFL